MHKPRLIKEGKNEGMWIVEMNNRENGFLFFDANTAWETYSLAKALEAQGVTDDEFMAR